MTISPIIRRLSVAAVVVSLLFGGTFLVQAQTGGTNKDDNFGLNDAAKEAYEQDVANLESQPAVVVGNVVGVLLSLLGIIFLVQIVIAGVRWLTADGNDEKITKARKTIIQGIIGMVITVSAYVITDYVLDVAIQATQGGS